MDRVQASASLLNQKLHTLLDEARSLKDKIQALELNKIERGIYPSPRILYMKHPGENITPHSSPSLYPRKILAPDLVRLQGNNGADRERDRYLRSANGGLHTAPGQVVNSTTPQPANGLLKHGNGIRDWIRDIPLHDLLHDCVLAEIQRSKNSNNRQEGPPQIDVISLLSTGGIPAVASAFERGLQPLLARWAAEPCATPPPPAPAQTDPAAGAAAAHAQHPALSPPPWAVDGPAAAAAAANRDFQIFTGS